MGDKKHIDRLFQESFKDFEATPSDAVWKHIERQLNEKNKKRRVIPIWWRYAGVAALLLLLLTVGGVYFNSTQNNQPNQVVETEDITRPTQSSEELINSNDTKIVVENDNSEKNNLEKSTQIKTDGYLKTSVSSKQSSIVGGASSSNENESKNNSKLLSNKKSKAVHSLFNQKNNNAIVSNSGEKSNSTNNAIVSSNSKNNNENLQNKESLITTKKARELIDNSSNDSSVLAEVEKNKTKENLLTIEEALDKTKDIIEKDKNLNRWSIAPNAAPVYFNTLGEGSSIDPQFNSNSKTGELNMSYGINASYAISEKLKVRSGINKVNLGYNTNNVIVFQSVGVSSSKRSLRNVSGNSSGNSAENVSVISGENFNANSIPFASSNTSINQALGYIEVPLEIQYALTNKKLSVNVIGGFSSFFLSDNKIFSEAENGTKTLLGEASNINKTSFSANLGLGFNYKASKKIDLNIEPMFKYQINTFNNTSGNFNPYFIGVYTGFAIKF